MRTIQLELEDTLAERLAPYQNNLADLVELGLQAWQERQQQENLARRERLLQVLAASGKVKVPRSYTGEKPYVRRTPIPITGKPVSELIIEQRGVL